MKAPAARGGGVAAADGRFGASGVAPAARLMPIRMVSDLGSMQEADAFHWAAEHGADVISCSWGPRDGRWFDPQDPRHNAKVPLPDSTRLAIGFALGALLLWLGHKPAEPIGYRAEG